MNPPTPITDQAGVDALARDLAAAGRVALDTEADSLHAYPEKLCLIQLSFDGRDDLVDPLAPVDLAPLFAALAPRELILHGADYDLRLLYRHHGFVPERVFDTMLAARLLGEPKLALAALLEAHVGVRLDKSGQKANWATRPLPARLLAYAVLDTRHLAALAATLDARLAALGRCAWHREACDRLVADCATRPEPDADAWRVRGAQRLDRRALALLRVLWQWREDEAVAAGKPPYFVLAHEALVDAAEAAANGEAPALPRGLSERRHRGALAALRRAAALPESAWPPRSPPRHPRPDVPRDALARLTAARDEAALRLRLDPTVVASRAALEAVAARPADAHLSLMAWQQDLLADAIASVSATTRDRRPGDTPPPAEP